MPQDKITDLSYLTEVSSGDPDFINEMITIFFSQVPEFIENMEKHFQEGNYIDLGKEAHKAKSSVLIVGMNDLGVKMKELQIFTENNEKIELYRSYIDDFTSSCLQAVEELKEYLETL